MTNKPIDYQSQTIEQRMGLRPLNKIWSKAEIVFGFGAMWCAIHPKFIDEFVRDPELAMIASAGMFVLGGYLASAGSRSHLYQSLNKQTAFLAEQIDGR